jgi:hypothetical protein
MTMGVSGEVARKICCGSEGNFEFRHVDRIFCVPRVKGLQRNFLYMIFHHLSLENAHIGK